MKTTFIIMFSLITTVSVYGLRDVAVLIGEYTAPLGRQDTVEALRVPLESANNSCPSLPKLDMGRSFFTSFVLEEKPLVCGGYASRSASSYSPYKTDDCEYLDFRANEWRHHSSLTTTRWHAATSLIDGERCILGGATQPTTLECWKGDSWKVITERIPRPGYYGGCHVNYRDEVLLIGGLNAERAISQRRISRPPTPKGVWSKKVIHGGRRGGTWSSAAFNDLPEGRRGHGCSLIKDKSSVLVVGGLVDSSSGQDTASTVIIDLVTGRNRRGNSMLKERSWPVIINDGFKTYVMGGVGRRSTDRLPPIEVYDEDTENWRNVAGNIGEPRNSGTSVMVPTHIVGC